MAEVKMPEYPDNSDASKVEAPVPVRDDEPKAILRKKSAGKRIAESIIPKSDRKEIANYILLDVALPALKDTVSEMVINTVQMLLYPGESRSDYKKRRDGYHKSYGNSPNKYQQGSNKYRSDNSSRRKRVNLDDVLFYTRKDARYAYGKLLDRIDEYGSAKVSDLFDEVNITLDWPADDVGWEELPDEPVIDIVRVRNESGELERKYCLNLPNPYRLNS